MRMSNADVVTYPKFARYVRTALPQVVSSPTIVRAMMRIGQLNKATLQAALTWNQGPNIVITGIAAYGEFTPDAHSNEIRIQTALVQDHEAGRDYRNVPAGKVRLAGITLLHELVHWGDDQDGIDRAGEEGEEFERAVYGAVIG